MGKDDKIRVFLSRPNPFTEEQAYLIEQLKLWLIGQKELVKIAVEIEISVFMAILSCF